MEITIHKGPLTSDRIPQLNINTLVKNGYIKEGKRMEGNYQAKPGDPELVIISDLTTENRFVKIKFKSLTNSAEITQTIPVCTVKSNLGGKGKFNLYLGVPDNKSKILFFNHWDQLYVPRKDYPYKIYYPIEICSKTDRPFERGYIIRQKLLKGLLDFKNYNYRGDMTSIHKRIEKIMQTDKAIRLLLDEREERLIKKFGKKIN